MTSFPAQGIGLKDRGMLKEGFWADIVVFDPKRVLDRATFMEPMQFPDGIEYVLVSEEVVVEGGKPTGLWLGKSSGILQLNSSITLVRVKNKEGV
ncbi:MAG: hypothetical protein DRO05_00200 [Thermoproteota archaeon]|nr:MAG: hypothetical protein DRO05_00200 [Candidatus Korarchaeota archaeon]